MSKEPPGRVPDAVRLLFGNVTRHGKKDVQYLRRKFDDLDLWLFSEMHVPAVNVEAERKTLLKDGWHAKLAAAAAHIAIVSVRSDAST